MKKVTGNNRLVLIIISFTLLFTFISCQQSYDFNDEIIAIKRFMRYYDDPNNLNISVLDKYNISEREIYYYLEWSYPQENDTETYDLLLIYNPETQMISLAFFSDMEYGLFADVKLKWDEIKDSPDMSFSDEEISIIKQSAIDILNEEKSM